MIKEMIWVGLVFLLILAICILTQWEIVHGTKDILEALVPVENAAAKENWQQAREHFHIVKQKWEKTSAVWKMLINHDDMKDIDISINDTAAFLELEEREAALGELASLRFFLSHVHANEKPDWGNIF